MKSISDLLSALPLLTTSLLVAVALLAALITSVDLGTRFRVEWMGSYFIGVLLVLVTGVVLTGRDVSMGLDTSLRPDSGDTAAGDWASRGITLLCMAIAAERAFRFLLRREFRTSHGNGLLVALLAYMLSVNIVAPMFGTPGGFRHHLIYAPLALFAVFGYAQTQSERCIVLVRNSILAFLLVSLLCLAARPEWVTDSRYLDGVLPGFTVRFYGFSAHPNSLAPLCLLLICCLRLRRFNRAGVNALGWSIAVISLALTQSKTSIGLVLLALGYFWLFDQKRRVLDIGPKEHRRWQATTLTSVVMLIGMLGMLVLGLQLAGGIGVFARLDQLDDKGQLSTLSGRTDIWLATMKAFEGNPLFGYGPELWGLEFRIKTGLPYAHAHNQFIHTLGAAGVVGLVALLICLGAMSVAAWRTRSASHGVSLVLFVFLLLRGLTEVPLDVSNPMLSEFLFLAFLLVVCVAGLSTRTSVRPRVARVQVAHQASRAHVGPAT